MKTPKNISSDKCDFRIKVGQTRVQVSDNNKGIEVDGATQAGRFAVDSSKCDWRISNIANGGSVSVYNTPEGTDLTGKLKDFSGRLSSSKCAYRINVLDSGNHLQVNSDKCDWRIHSRTNAASLQANMASDYLSLQGRLPNIASDISSDKCDFTVRASNLSNKLRVDSAKCDWNISLKNDFATGRVQNSDFGVDVKTSIGKGATAGVSSSKCDWSIYAYDELIKYNVAGTPDNFISKSQIKGFSSGVSSSKCDFTINSINETTFPLNLKVDGIGSNMAVSSSKCDWSIRALGGARVLPQRPVFNANLSSSKCDFTLNIEFGIINGKPIRLKAISSSKCDFTIESLNAKIKK